MEERVFWGSLSFEKSHHIGGNIQLRSVVMHIMKKTQTPANVREAGQVSMTGEAHRPLPYIMYMRTRTTHLYVHNQTQRDAHYLPIIHT